LSNSESTTTLQMSQTSMDTGRNSIFHEVPPHCLQGSPKIPPKLPGFHHTAWDEKEKKYFISS
jgi:hypothetical protein